MWKPRELKTLADVGQGPQKKKEFLEKSAYVCCRVHRRSRNRCCCHYKSKSVTFSTFSTGLIAASFRDYSSPAMFTRRPHKINQPTPPQRCRSETENFILENLKSSVLSQFKKYHSSGNLKCNNLSIFQNLKLRIYSGKNPSDFS